MEIDRSMLHHISFGVRDLKLSGEVRTSAAKNPSQY
jgi:hypothetical protein